MAYVHNFDEPIDRLNTDSYKWDYEGEGGKYIPLGVADTDFKAPQPIIDAIRQRVDLGVYAYGYLPQKRFSDAVCGWYRKRLQLELEPEAVRYSQGLMTGALWMLLNAFSRPFKSPGMHEKSQRKRPWHIKGRNEYSDALWHSRTLSHNQIWLEHNILLRILLLLLADHSYHLLNRLSPHLLHRLMNGGQRYAQYL